MKQLEILFSKTINPHTYSDIAETISRMKQEVMDLPDSEMQLRTIMGRNVSAYCSDNTIKALGTIQSAVYRSEQLPVMLIAAMAYLQQKPDLLDALEGLYTPLPTSPEVPAPVTEEDATETVLEAVETMPEPTLDAPKKRGRRSK